MDSVSFVNASFMFLGWACVAWTIYESLRLIRTVEERGVPLSRKTGRSDEPRSVPGTRGEGTKRRRKTYAAWDERGRPIDVEDMSKG